MKRKYKIDKTIESGKEPLLHIRDENNKNSYHYLTKVLEGDDIHLIPTKTLEETMRIQQFLLAFDKIPDFKNNKKDVILYDHLVTILEKINLKNDEEMPYLEFLITNDKISISFQEDQNKHIKKEQLKKIIKVLNNERN